MFLVTSNIKKLNEFKSFGLDIPSKSGPDLKEVKGNSIEVITYKALQAGIGSIVEDTILEISGEEIVDIRWKINTLDNLNNLPANWIVSLGYNTGSDINIYRGIISGHICLPIKKVEDSFGFDPYFIPDGQNMSLSELSAIGKKDQYSARKNAVINLINKQHIKSIPIISINPWEGEYQ